jgi:hypothetical protein
MAVAQELQELVQLQQQELHKLQQQQQQQPATALHVAADPSSRYISGPWQQQQPSAAAGQLEAANAELRQQLTGTTARLQDMEAAMSRLLEQQVRVDSARRMVQVCCAAKYSTVGLCEVSSGSVSVEEASRLCVVLLHAAGHWSWGPGNTAAGREGQGCGCTGRSNQGCDGSTARRGQVIGGVVRDQAQLCTAWGVEWETCLQLRLH